MAQLLSSVPYRAIDANGNPMPGAVLEFYQTGTSTPQAVYSDSGATTSLGTTVTASAAGLFVPIYLANANLYKLILKDSSGNTVQTEDPVNSANASPSFTPQGRLTLASGTPVMAASQLSATTIYYTPYSGNQAPIWDGTQFTSLTFSELSNITTASSSGNAGPAAVTTNSNYDLFVWSNGGVATLTRGPAWTSDTARGTGAGTTELTRIGGVLLNANSITNGPAANKGTYVGTVRSDGSSQINWQLGAVAANGTAAILGVWNAYNRMRVCGLIGDTTDSWTYTTATVRAANGSNTMRASFVQGLQEDFFSGEYIATGLNSANSIMVAGIGYDATAAFSGRTSLINTSNIVPIIGSHRVQALGFHFMQACEHSAVGGTSTWYGDNGSGTLYQSGLTYEGKF